MAILEAQTIPEYFLRRTELYPDSTAIMFKKDGEWKEITWRQYKDIIQDISLGLRHLGLKPGDKVAILSKTRPEWAFSDFGIICAGLVTVPVYSSNTPEDVAYILNDAQCRAIFVENPEQLAKVREIKEKVPTLKHVIAIEESGHTDYFKVTSWNALRALGKEENRLDKNAFERIANGVQPRDLITIVYTSGTTGVPKGVELSSEQFVSVIQDIDDSFTINEKDTLLCFLPTAHIIARAVDQMGNIGFGFVAAYAESLEKLVDNIAEIRPTIMVCVPRIYEKVYAKIVGGVAHSSKLKQKIFWWAHNIGLKYSKALQEKKTIPPLLRLQYALAFKLVFSKLKARFGGRLRFFVSGGAPLSAEIGKFFHAAGLLILEGWGLTETTGPLTVNREEHFKFGTVGLPLKEVQIKIGEDGEILIKSKKMFLGYHNLPKDSKESFIDGWFKTGDIGEIDVDGFLKITDRKKDLIVTAGGKNIAPQKIEQLLKTSRFIANTLIHGDRRKYLAAIVTLNFDEVSQWAKEHQLNFSSFQDLSSHPKVNELIEGELKKINDQLASFETIKRFYILDRDFSIEEGELTPSLKVKRKFCEKRYADILDGLYSEQVSL